MGIKCPKCGGKNLHAITETETAVKTSGGGYSATKGCLGWLAFGPFGLLCGNCGQSTKTSVNTTNKNYWVCGDCGHRFRNLDDLRAEIEQREKTLKSGIVLCVICFLAAIISFAIHISFLAWFCLIVGIIYIILIPMLKNRIDNDWKEYNTLEQTSMER